MKKLLLSIFIITMMLSCSNGDTKTTTPTLIIGKWKVEKSTDPTYQTCDFSGWDEFKEGGAYSNYDDCNKSTTSGSWTLSGDNLTMIMKSFPIPFTGKIISLTQTSMVLSFVPLGSATAEQTTFKKIN